MNNQTRRPKMLCIDCGHIGPATKPPSNGFGMVGEVIVFFILLACGIIPGIIYAIFVSIRTNKAKDLRVCGKCKSSQIQLKQ